MTEHTDKLADDHLEEVNLVIQRLGGVNAAAKFLRCKHSSICQWRRHSIPAARLMYLQVARADVLSDTRFEAGYVDERRQKARAENTADKISRGTLLHGESHPNSKLSAQQVIEIREAYTNRVGKNWGCNEFARRFDVSTTIVCLAATGKSWKHL